MEQPSFNTEKAAEISVPETKLFNKQKLLDLINRDEKDGGIISEETELYMDGYKTQEGMSEIITPKIDSDLQTAAILEKKGETELALIEYRHILHDMLPLFSIEDKDTVDYEKQQSLRESLIAKCKELEARLEEEKARN